MSERQPSSGEVTNHHAVARTCAMDGDQAPVDVRTVNADDCGERKEIFGQGGAGEDRLEKPPRPQAIEWMELF